MTDSQPTIRLYAQQRGKTQATIDAMLEQATERGIRVEVVYPAVDEREVLWDAFDEMHEITEGGCDTRGKDVADMVLRLGFHRTVQGEPSDAAVEEREAVRRIQAWLDSNPHLGDKFKSDLRLTLRAAAATEAPSRADGSER